MVYMHAARTNLTSNDVSIGNYQLGEGTFRTVLEGTYEGGNRNGQEAACKRFKSQYRQLEDEFFAQDSRITEKTVNFATDWNEDCPHGKEILVNQGSIQYSRSGIKYLVEPLIRYFKKYTSNNRWIGNVGDWQVRCMAAFSHYTYHRSGGQMIVCDIQGRYRHDRYGGNKRRFELTDPAICSRNGRYGPTDLGEKGIDSFFSNHTCNEFCKSHWQRPRATGNNWFAQSSGTTMVSSQVSNQLRLTSPATFGGYALNAIAEDYSDLDSYSDDSDSYW